MKCHLNNNKPQQYYVYNDFHFNDHNAWGQIGQALGRNETLCELSVIGDVNVNTAIKPEAARCLEAFYEGLKENKSIECLIWDIFPSSTVAMFDLRYFLRNNDKIKHLRLTAEEALTPDQSRNIASALEGVSLREFDMYKCMFGDNASFEQIVNACLGVQTLALSCENCYQYAALSALLRDSRAVLSELHLYPDKTPGDIMKGGMSVIAANLIGNTRLKKINVRFGIDEDFDSFSKLLCDASSIDSIRTSNHTLEEIVTVNCLPKLVAECLELNRIEDKDEVIRKKIAHYYDA
jgi:hypothetical protein